MGVTGSGKTTVGRALADAIGGRFVDGDDLHPQKNIAKMRRGEPLNDVDREPWLDAVSRVLCDDNNPPVLIVACSALKKRYRARLRRCDYRLVYLKGEAALIAERLLKRQEHFMPAALLASQFEALEEPEDAITVEITRPLYSIVGQIVGALNLPKLP